MAEILLAVVTVALLIERVFSQREHASQMKRLLNQVAAQSTHELVMLNRADLPAVKTPPADRGEQIIPIGA